MITDPPERTLIAQTFAEHHRHRLRALFDLLGVPWLEDAGELAAAAARHWLAPEHGQKHPHLHAHTKGPGAGPGR
ncbi:hypothetical protein GCM10018779_32660 [Streptomyces griseocarneus]|nr:hypothetical protein GCM10018779_32660 [Streptomyces griseocarneus]